MTAVAAIVGALVVVSWAYWALALAAVSRLFRSSPAPLPRDLPPVSILKPLRGVDAGALESFRTFCRQDYPDFEVVFGVAEATDPAVEVVERLRGEFPAIPIRLVVAAPSGANRKASLLEALARAARHPVLVVNDSDMRAGRSYLAHVVGALLREGVGLVTCPYCGEGAGSLPAGLEALHMGVTFLPSAVLASRVLRMPVAMGATLALRRSDLERVGGFAAVEGYLADDYQIGARVAVLGRKIALCPYAMRCVLGRTGLRDEWNRELRWARATRASQPAGYVGYLATFSTPLALALLLSTHLGVVGWAGLAGSLLVRWAVALALTRETGDVLSKKWLALLPMRDLLTAAVWAASFVGRRVVWRGEAFDVAPGGTIVPGEAVGWMAPSAGVIGTRSTTTPRTRG